MICILQRSFENSFEFPKTLASGTHITHSVSERQIACLLVIEVNSKVNSDTAEKNEPETLVEISTFNDFGFRLGRIEY